MYIIRYNRKSSAAANPAFVNGMQTDQRIATALVESFERTDEKRRFS